MTRIVRDRGHQIFFDHGDGLGGMSATIGSVENADANAVARVAVWKFPSTDGTTDVDGKFAVGDTVMTRADYGIENKVHEMTFRGTYTYTDADGNRHIFMVLHNTTSCGGSFLLVGPSLPSKAFNDAIIADFNNESDITAESYVVHGQNPPSCPFLLGAPCGCWKLFSWQNKICLNLTQKYLTK